MTGFIAEIIREVQAGSGAGRGAVRQGETISDARQRENDQLTKAPVPTPTFWTGARRLVLFAVVGGVLLLVLLLGKRRRFF